MEYLITGTVKTTADAIAIRLAGIQRSYLDRWEEIDRCDDSNRTTLYLQLLNRLKWIREASGYPTADSAAAANGWSRTLYWNHETGVTFMHPDVFIGYCLSLGGRPEFGLLGEGDMKETGLTEWQERSVAGPPSEDASWRR